MANTNGKRARQTQGNRIEIQRETRRSANSRARARGKVYRTVAPWGGPMR